MATELIADPQMTNHRYRCTSLAQWSDTNVDVSEALQRCIDGTPVNATLELPAGRYIVNHQIHVDHRIGISSVGKNLDDPICVAGQGDCAELVASPALNEPWGILNVSALKSLDHIVLDGNKQGRAGTPSYDNCVSDQNNRYGVNAGLDCDDCQVTGNVFTNALCGTGLEVHQGHAGIVITNNLFSDNGVHTHHSLWADGLTIHDSADSEISGNVFIDNTDIDMILGGCQNYAIQDNRVTHTSSPTGGAFVAMMLYKWPSTSGDYSGTDVSGNIIDCGPTRNCGTGLYIATEGWYPGAPFGQTLANPVQATIHHNEVRNVKSGMYVAARDFTIYANQYTNAHGTPFQANCGTLVSHGPIVVSSTSTGIEFRGEDEDEATRDLFDYLDWKNCIPN